jgi:hypothetical protein
MRNSYLLSSESNPDPLEVLVMDSLPFLTILLKDCGSQSTYLGRGHQASQSSLREHSISYSAQHYMYS